MATRLARQLGFDTDPRPLQLLGEAGFLLSYLGRWDEATEVFEALATLAPADPLAYLALAENHLLRGEHAEAETMAGRALKAAIGRPADDVTRSAAARAQLLLARAVLQQDRPGEARAALAKAVELEPTGASGRLASDLLAKADALGLTD